MAGCSGEVGTESVPMGEVGSGAMVVKRWEWEGRESLSGRNLPSTPPHPPASLPLHEKAGLKGQQDWVGSPSGPQGTHRVERGGQANKERHNASSPHGGR